MAVLIGKKVTEQTSGATITPSFSGLDIQTGDWIGICLTNDHPSGSTPSIAPPAGWTKVDTAFTVSGGIEHGWIYKLAASGAEAAPVITVNSDDCIALVEVWRYVDQTTPIDCVATRADWNLASTATCNVASASAGAVVIYSVGADAAHRMRFKLSDAVCDDRRYSSAAAIAHLVGHRQIEAAGNFPAIVAYGRDANEGGTFCAFALRNASGGAKQPDVRVTSQELAWYGAFGATHDGITWLAPDQFAGTGVTIGGYAVSATTPTVGNAVAETVAANWGTATQLTTSDATADILMGGCHTITSANLTDCVASIEWRANLASTSSRSGTAGVLIGFSDGTNWSVFQIATKEYSWDTADIHAALVAIGTGKATAFATSGTLDVTAVTKAGFFWHKATANSGDALVIRNLTAISKVALTGGGSLRPAKPTDISTALNAMGHIELVRLQSTKQVQVRHNVQLGDGTNATYYDHTAFSVEFPGRWSASQMDNWQMYWNALANAIEIREKAKASDTINGIAGVFASDVEQNYVMDSATSASATYSQSGSSVVNFAYTGDTNAPVVGRTFSGCDTVAFEGENVTGVTITGTTSTNAAASFSASGAVLLRTSIDGTGAAYALELDTGVTAITLTDCTITAGSTAKTHVLATTGTVTITIGGSTVSPTYVSAGATVVISAPVVTADISITGMSNTVGANNRLQIINTTAISAADWTANTPYTAGDVVLRTSGIGSENTAGLYFRATTGGTSHVTTEPTWNTTVGGTTTDGTVVWTTYAILYYDADPAATSLTDTYIDGEEFKAGETVEIRFAEEDPAVSFKIYSTSVIAATTGFSALANSTADSVYATYALSGAAYDTTYSPNYVASYMVLDTNTNFTGASSFAYYCYLLTTSEGMYRFWGGLTALDPGNVRNNVSVLDLFFDETAGFVRQTDDVRIFKSDGTRPALDPTTGGAGIEINWKVPVNVVTTGGSAVLPQDILDIADAVWVKVLP